MAEAELESETESKEVLESPIPAKKLKSLQKTHISAAKYKCTFNSEWCKTYPIKAVRNDRHSFCIPCGKSLSCSHQGIKDVKVHCAGQLHKKHAQSSKNNKSVLDLFAASTADTVTRAEVMATNFLIQHNLPISTSDHLGPLFRAMFPDNKIAKHYGCGRSKIFAIINKALGPHCHEYVVNHIKKHPFSLGINGSSDMDVEKMNPMTVRIFDINGPKTVSSHFYKCVTSGRDASKADTIFKVVQIKMEDDDIAWSQAVNLSVDNTNSMIGTHNSFASRCKAQNEDIYVLGCPCHLAHIAASNTNDAFAEISGINVEDLLIDLYYWFEKSTKGKGVLAEYMEFCDQEYLKILKHSSTRWLSLERCNKEIRGRMGNSLF